jgi:hypothetical protein
MITFLKFIEYASDKLAVTYHLDLGIFLIIYISSIIPLYLGIFIMIYGSTRNLRFKDIVRLKFKEGFHFGKQSKVGLIIHIFGLILPYAYIFIFGRHLPLWIYIMFTCLLGMSILWLCKKIMSTSKLTASGISVIKKTTVEDPIESNKLWGIYNRTFEPINEISPCKQSLDADHFFESLKDNKVHKYILIKEGLDAIGIALIAHDFKHTPWISEDYFRVNYPEHFENKTIYYFMGLAIEPEFRGNRYSINLIENIVDDLPAGSIMGFDHSKNVNPMLHHFTRIVKQARDISRTHIDRQHYHIVKKLRK